MVHHHHFQPPNMDKTSNHHHFPQEIVIWQCVKTLVPLVNIKIAGKWMFIPLKMVLILRNSQ